MKVKLANPDSAAGLKDPHTKRSPFIDPETQAVVEVAEVPDNAFWNRRMIAGEIVRIDEDAKQRKHPTGNEPVAPLTTRTPRS